MNVRNSIKQITKAVLATTLIASLLQKEATAQISYTQGWETTGLNSWTTSGSGSFSRVTTTPCAGTGVARANNYFGGTSNLVSPALTGTNGGDLNLTFKYKVTQYSNNSVAAPTSDFASLVVDWGTSTSGPFTTAYTITQADHVPSASCATKNVTITGMPASGNVYIRFRFTAASGADNYVYIDDVSITQSPPPSCVVPGAVSFTTVTNNAALMSWVASPSTPANGYQYYLSTSATPPTSSTPATGSTAAGVTTENLTTLTPNTQYYAWVRSLCSGTDTSSWNGGGTFTTQVLEPRPYFEGFEGSSYPGYTIYGTTPWYVGAPSTLGGNPGNSLYANLYSSYPSGIITSLNVGPINANDSLSFDYKNVLYSSVAAPPANAGYVKILLSSNWGDTYTQIDSFTMIQNTDWNRKAYSLSAYAGQNVKIRVEAYRSSGDYYIGFDNLAIGSCKIPSNAVANNITDNSATIEWTPPSTIPANGYSYYVSTTNSNPPSATAPTGMTTTNSVSLSMLTPATPYYVWIRSKCSATDSSAWMGPLIFTTLCSSYNLPYAENFDGAFPPACWDLKRGQIGTTTLTSSLTNTSSWVQDDWLNVSGTDQAAKLNVYVSTKRDWLISPSIDLGTNGNNTLSFDIGIVSYGNSTAATLDTDDTIRVLISKDNGTTWNLSDALLTINTTNGPLSATGAQSYQYTLSDTGKVRFAFYVTEGSVSGTDNDVMINNFSVTPPPCTPPTVDLGPDTTICEFTTLMLDGGAGTGYTYTWSTGATTQTIDVTTTGTYSVSVSNGTCAAADTIVVAVANAPIVDLGNDSTDCTNGGPITLTAGSSTDDTYLWNTGATTNTIDALTSGSYSVTVTNAAGCSTSDTVVLVIGVPPTVGGITVTGTSPNFNFSANNPSNVNGYSWDFGDGATSDLEDPTHNYTAGTADQAYTVTLIVSNDCGADTVTTSVTVKANSLKGLSLNNEVLKLYPNPSTDVVVIENHTAFTVKNITIYNMLGQEILSEATNSNLQHKINISHLATGVYQVKINFEEGFVNRKLEIIR
jgi:hypothetical protein